MTAVPYWLPTRPMSVPIPAVWAFPMLLLNCGISSHSSLVGRWSVHACPSSQAYRGLRGVQRRKSVPNCVRTITTARMTCDKKRQEGGCKENDSMSGKKLISYIKLSHHFCFLDGVNIRGDMANTVLARAGGRGRGLGVTLHLHGAVARCQSSG